jgi:hypothetical protein
VVGAGGPRVDPVFLNQAKEVVSGTHVVPDDSVAKVSN